MFFYESQVVFLLLGRPLSHHFFKYDFFSAVKFNIGHLKTLDPDPDQH
jgi:hypothetical protein